MKTKDQINVQDASAKQGDYISTNEDVPRLLAELKATSLIRKLTEREKTERMILRLIAEIDKLQKAYDRQTKNVKFA